MISLAAGKLLEASRQRMFRSNSCRGCCTICGNRDIVSFLSSILARRSRRRTLEAGYQQPGPLLLFIARRCYRAGETEAALIPDPPLLMFCVKGAEGACFSVSAILTMAAANAMFDRRSAIVRLLLFMPVRRAPGACAGTGTRQWLMEGFNQRIWLRHSQSPVRRA